MCLAKEDVEKKLAQTEHRAESLRAQLETEAAAKDEAAKECQRLHALTQELENKVDLLTVVQSELESVDMLQVELSMEQEKNGALEGELRKKKDDYEELCEQMKREVENSACFQRDLAAREEAVSQTNKKFDEAIENLKLVRFFSVLFFLFYTVTLFCNVFFFSQLSPVGTETIYILALEFPFPFSFFVF